MAPSILTTSVSLEVDHYTVRDPATGLRHAVSIAASDEEKAAAECAGLRRELAGVEFKLAHLEDDPLPWVEPPSEKWIERERTSLEGTRKLILARLAELEPNTKEAKRRGKAA